MLKAACETVPSDLAAAEDFRLAMRSMAATVTIVSTELDGQRYGMTATAVTSISMAPPSLLVSIRKGASIHDPLTRRGMACINVLRRSHRQHCMDFSGGKTGEERFDDDEWGRWMGLPCLMDAQANICCEVAQTLVYGTHTLFLCSVVGTRTRDEIDPLIYLSGSFVTPGAN